MRAVLLSEVSPLLWQVIESKDIGGILHGDLHGVQTVPLRIAPDISAAAARHTAADQALIGLCRSPEFTLARLRAAVGGH